MINFVSMCILYETRFGLCIPDIPALRLIVSKPIWLYRNTKASQLTIYKLRNASRIVTCLFSSFLIVSDRQEFQFTEQM